MRGFAPKLASKLTDQTFAQAETRAAKIAGFRWQDVNVLDAMRRVKVPVLLFHGGRDDWIPPRHTELLAQAAPTGSRREVIPDDDHFSLMLRFDLVGPPALAWFDQQLCGASETGTVAHAP
jgi:pimeloyl-ACP methyl ester carboxylesterase